MSLVKNEPSLTSLFGSISAPNKQELETDGKKIYKSNDFMRSLANLMEHPEFGPLIKQYFDSWENIQLFMGFLKLYEKIGDQFPEFNGYQKLSMVKSLIGNSHARQIVCDEVRRTFNDRVCVVDQHNKLTNIAKLP